MYTVDDKAKYRTAHRDGMTIRQITRSFHVSRRKVREASIESLLLHLSPSVATTIQLQHLSGARPQEAVAIHPCEVTTDGDVWSPRQLRRLRLTRSRDPGCTPDCAGRARSVGQQPAGNPPSAALLASASWYEGLRPGCSGAGRRWYGKAAGDSTARLSTSRPGHAANPGRQLTGVVRVDQAEHRAERAVGYARLGRQRGVIKITTPVVSLPVPAVVGTAIRGLSRRATSTRSGR
jgi:hypothetical protein